LETTRISFPDYSRAERTADAAVHLVGILFGIAGAAALIVASIGRLPIGEVTGLLVYGTGLVGMFVASASYNFATAPERKAWLRRIDHSVIFVMIAGSYTPFAIRIGGETGFALLVAVWGVAALGILAKLAFPGRIEKLSVIFYLAQGWCILFATGPLTEAVPSGSINLLIVGGCVYSAGVIFHLLTMLPFHNVIWHLFVLAGAAIQYASIYSAIIR
jgi:hemolysin III